VPEPTGKKMISPLSAHLVRADDMTVRASGGDVYQVMEDPMLRWCPTRGCETIVRLPTPGAAGAKCPTCARKFCALCGCRRHPLRTCEMVRGGR
jgi:hypothetical protein